MRHSTTIRRRVAGYAKRKRKDSKPVPPPSSAATTTAAPASFQPRRSVIAAVPIKAPWMQAYGVPLLLLLVLGLLIAFAGRLSSSLGLGDRTVPSSPREISRQSRDSDAAAAPSEFISGRRPLPTDQSFLATHYGRPSETTPAPSSTGIFHSTASGRCVINTHNAAEIASVVEGCLRRPN